MSLFPIAYFPSIAYMQALCKSENIILDIHEHWIKQSIRNRCEILTSNGVQKLVIPIVHNDQKQAIGTIEPDFSQPWQRTHWRTIQTAYKNSPYFEDYAWKIASFLEEFPKNLYEGNILFLNWIIEEWELPLSIKYSSSFSDYSEDDVRKVDWCNRDIKCIPYQQVFSYGKPFCGNLSVLDLLFNEGPLGRKWILI